MFSRFLAHRKLRRQRKQLHHLIGYAWKRVRQDQDLLTEKQQMTMRREIQRAQNALMAEDSNVAGAEERLVDAYNRCFPPSRWASWRENGEIILVALVVAMAVRAFFLQPFKIPTGSMQPTLNGVTIRQVEPHQKAWWYRIIALPLFGERIVHLVAETEGTLENVRSVQFRPLHFGGKNSFVSFFPMDATEFQVGRTRYQVPIERSKFIQEVLGMGQGSPPLIDPDRFFKKGETLLECVVQTGDQLFVDRFTYYFRKPRRGDVFVFETKGIQGVPSPGEFYIKRLAGLPGDTLQIQEPYLFVNGAKIADPPAFLKVMSQQNGYRGYANRGEPFQDPSRPSESFQSPSYTYTLKTGKYFALGDNSFSSSDSRFWGPVPYRNIVGRGFFVYWPFTKHFGRVE